MKRTSRQWQRRISSRDGLRSGLPLVFDTTCLSHFARADRLDVLGDLVAGVESYISDGVWAEIREERGIS